MILIALLFVIQFVNLLNATLPVLSLKMQFVMLNARNLNVKLNAQTKDVKCLTAQNA